MRNDIGADRTHPLQKSLMIAARIHRGVRSVHDTAMVDVRPEFAALLQARNSMGFDLESLRLVRNAPREHLVLRGIAGGVEAAAPHPPFGHLLPAKGREKEIHHVSCGLKQPIQFVK